MNTSRSLPDHEALVRRVAAKIARAWGLPAPRTALPPGHGEKVRRGQERARARGVHVGRPTNPALTPDVLERARVMRATGMRIRAIAADLHVPKSTLHRVLKRP